MKRWTLLTVFLLTLILILPLPETYAANYSFTATAQKNFDKLTKDSTQTVRNKLQAQYDLLQANRKQELQLEQEAKKLKSNNQAREKQVRSAINQLDHQIIKRIEAELEQVTKKYEPIIKAYEQQRQQVTILKQLKPANKEIVKAANLALSITKVAADQAKQTIRNKKTELTKAKSKANTRKKELRALLTKGSPLLSDIKNINSSIGKQNKQFTAEGKQLTIALRSQSANDVLSSLQTMNQLGTIVNTYRKNIIQLEKQYNQIIEQVDQLLK